jgi:hypothetical protein
VLTNLSLGFSDFRLFLSLSGAFGYDLFEKNVKEMTLGTFWEIIHGAKRV